MTTSNQTEKPQATQGGNVKTLNAALQQGGSVAAMLAEMRAAKRKLDGLIFAQREALVKRQEEEALKKEAERPAPPPPPEKKTAKIIAGIPASGESEAEPAPAPAVQQPQPKAAEPAPQPQPPKPQKKDTFEPTASKVMPSYIRGTVTPPPPRPSYGQGRPPEGGRPPYGQGRPPEGGRPPYGQGRPDSRPPYGGTGAKPSGGFGASKAGTIPPPINKDRKPEKKKEYTGRADDKKTMSKRTLIRKGFITENIGDERMGSRKLKAKKAKDMPHIAARVEKAIITTENLTVKILSEKIGKTAQEIIKQLMLLGIMCNINSVVDFATMELVANELGVELELKIEQTKESKLEDMHDEADDEATLIKRPPVITVMGHVDHGKTSLLDAIRKTAVVAGEAGGITQHIGAYSVVCKNEKITFLDTPGHEAFTELRARGAKVTDIAVLVVAADDGVMPQTVEAINHARAAGVPIIIAINKIDKPGADIEKIKQELTQYSLIAEEWGGDTIMVPISAKKGEGIDKLLEMILFLAEYNNYRANPERKARGLIIEAKLDKGKGPVANVIVQNGTLKVGDFMVSGMTYGRVRAMVDDKGRNIKEAGPSTPVSILGLTAVPSAGEGLYAVDDERMARQVTEERNVKLRESLAEEGRQQKSLDELIGKINQGMLKELTLVVKADAQGSVDALKSSIARAGNEEVRVSVVHAGIGAINKSDIMLAEVAGALIIGFNVRPDSESRTLAEKAGVEIRLYNIIYEALDDIDRAVQGLVAPKYREVILGRAQIRNVFKITGTGIVAGSYVLSGKIQRGAKARIFRAGELIHEGTVSGLKRFKDDVKEVATGYECGITVSDMPAVLNEDEIEVFIMEQIK